MRFTAAGAALTLTLSILSGLGGLTTPSLAWAQAPSSRDEVAAQALFDEGQALMKERRFAEACIKFQSSHRIDPRPGTVLNLANCYEENGQTASAWARYVEASELAARENQREREKYARERARVLAPKLSRLTVKAQALPADAVVKRDGIVVDAGVLGAAVPVDPGEHTVDVVVREKTVWSKRIKVAPSTQAEVVVAPSSEWATPPAPAPVKPVESAPPAAEPTSQPIHPEAEERPRAGWPAQKTAALVAAGVGVVGIGLGTYFGLTASSRWSDAKDKCQPDGCPRDSIDKGSDAKTDATISTVAFIVGGVALAGAGVLWFSAPSRARGSESRSVRLLPTGDVRTGSAGLMAQGRF